MPSIDEFYGQDPYEQYNPVSSDIYRPEPGFIARSAETLGRVGKEALRQATVEFPKAMSEVAGTLGGPIVRAGQMMLRGQGEAEVGVSESPWIEHGRPQDPYQRALGGVIGDPLNYMPGAPAAARTAAREAAPMIESGIERYLTRTGMKMNLGNVEGGAKVASKAQDAENLKITAESVSPSVQIKEPAAAPNLIHTVRNATNMKYPEIYLPPSELARRAEAQVDPESPHLKEVFGVTRGDLYDIAIARKGNLPDWLPYAAKPGSKLDNEAVASLITPENTDRLYNALMTAQKEAPNLTRGMVPWYVSDPLFARVQKLVGKDDAVRVYNQLNNDVSVASAMSNVITEMKRGTGAHYARGMGRDQLEWYYRNAGKNPEDREVTSFSSEFNKVPGHMAHSTAHSSGWKKGVAGSGEAKIPAYYTASGVPETGFQTHFPVGDVHFGSAVGLTHTRPMVKNKAGILVPNASSLSMTEATAIAPYFRMVSQAAGLEAVPGQALAWGLFSPQTGVDTPIGAPKIELMAIMAAQAGKRLGISPNEALDRVILGKAHLGRADPALLGGIAGVGAMGAGGAMIMRGNGDAPGTKR